MDRPQSIRNALLAEDLSVTPYLNLTMNLLIVFQHGMMTLSHATALLDPRYSALHRKTKKKDPIKNGGLTTINTSKPMNGGRSERKSFREIMKFVKHA